MSWQEPPLKRGWPHYKIITSQIKRLTRSDASEQTRRVDSSSSNKNESTRAFMIYSVLLNRNWNWNWNFKTSFLFPCFFLWRTRTAQIASDWRRWCSTTRPATPFALSAVSSWRPTPSTKPPNGVFSPTSPPITTPFVSVGPSTLSWATAAYPLLLPSLLLAAPLSFCLAPLASCRPAVPILIGTLFRPSSLFLPCLIGVILNLNRAFFSSFPFFFYFALAGPHPSPFFSFFFLNFAVWKSFSVFNNLMSCLVGPTVCIYVCNSIYEMIIDGHYAICFLLAAFCERDSIF